MTTIKKGTILREKVFDGDYRKVLAVADDVVFTSGWEEDKESLIKEKSGCSFYTLDYITENYDIVEEEWKAEDLKEGDTYWCLDSVGDTVQGTRRNDVVGEDVFNYRLKTKNVFPTEKKAKEYRDKIMNS